MSNASATPQDGLISKIIPASIVAAVAAMFGLAANIGEEPAQRAMAAQTAPAVSAAATPSERQIEKIVRNYLLKNPEVLLEVQAAYEAKVEIEREKQATAALKNSADAVFRSASAPIIGDPKGDVTVVEFFDYNCGFCRRALDGMSKLVEKDPKVKVVFKELPIFGKDSEDAARIALAAAKQDKYWEVHRALLQREGKANMEKGLKISEDLGLDMEKLRADMDSEEIKGEVTRVQELAQQLGIQGTPYFLIDNKSIPGAPGDLYDQLTAFIGEVRKEGCQYC